MSDQAPEPMGELHRQRLSDKLAAAGPVQPTVIDNQGVERIVGPAVDPFWRPRRVGPTDEELEQAKTYAANAAVRRGTQSPGDVSEAAGAGVAREAFAVERADQEEQAAPAEEPAPAEGEG